MDQKICDQLAPGGILRAGVNLGNPLLITGKASNGDPDGVSPDMARTIAAKLGVELKIIPYPSPGVLADALAKGEWDIGMIAVEPARAETIAFTAAYVQIEATYLVRDDGPFNTVEDVDSTGTKIAISARSAYDLYLKRHLKNAELIRGEGLAGAVETFTSQNLDALAGLRPALLEDAKTISGTRVLEGVFTSVKQAVGCNPANKEAAQFLKGFVEELKGNGTVQGFIDKHGVTGRLAVGDPA